MANILRTAKTGGDWTANELSAYNITVVRQNKQEFFTADNLPDPAEPSVVRFMAAETLDDARDKNSRLLLQYLNLAMKPKLGFESALGNFAAELLKNLNYDDDNRIVFIRQSIPFLICGINSVAQTDVCVMDEDLVLLLLQEDKRSTTTRDLEPQIIAEAIAAFAHNNRKRRDRGLPPLDSVMFPCLTMLGTFPTFYKITVTAALSQAVQSGFFPETETRVLRYVPTVPRGNSEGMRPLPNRAEILRCLEAFKGFVGN